MYKGYVNGMNFRVPADIFVDQRYLKDAGQSKKMFWTLLYNLFI